MGDDHKKAFNALLANPRLEYSPRLEELLRYLVAQYGQGSSGVAGKVIGIDLFKLSLAHSFNDSIVRSSIARLRRLLEEYYRDDPEGSKSEFVVTIENRGQNGYRLEVTRRARRLPPLRAFLCHSSSDKESVRQLHQRLSGDGFAPWLDVEDLLPGQDWEHEIAKAVRSSQVIIVCLSASSVTKEGFVQKEIKMALDIADEKPEGTIFIIPLRFEDCAVPSRIKRWHWVNYFDPNGYDRLVKALKVRMEDIEGQQKH